MGGGGGGGGGGAVPLDRSRCRDLAQAGYTTFFTGVIVLSPALKAHDHLSLTEIGVVLGAPSIGAIFTLYPWGGLASDRFGERSVIGTGLVACAACLAAAAFVSSFAGLFALLFLAGGFGAAVNSASGRAVMHWFDARQRGLALGIRQTALPIGGAAVALALPPLGAATDPKPSLLALASASPSAASSARRASGGTEPTPEARRPRRATPLRDRGMWVLSIGSALLVAPQVCLGRVLRPVPARAPEHDHGRGRERPRRAQRARDRRPHRGGPVVGPSPQPDRAAPPHRPRLRRTRPLLHRANGSAPLVVLVPLLVLMGCVTISWNGLAFAATAEIAGHGHAAARALGVQQTAVAFRGGGAADRIRRACRGDLLGGSPSRLSALFPLAGRRLLASLPG